MSRTLLKRAVAAAAALGMLGAASLVIAPAAGAAEVGGITAEAKSNPYVINNTSEADAGDVWITTPGIPVNDTITLQVAPPTGSACVADTTKDVWFDTTPTVQYPAGGGQVVVTLGKTAGCPKDNLVILKGAGNAAVPAGVVKVTDITYSVGDDVSIGQVKLVVGGAGQISNARVAGVDRISGATRYETAGNLYAACTSNANRISHVALVSGANFPDALAASYLGIPILLVEPTGVPDATKIALMRMGVRNVTIVGGLQAVGAGVPDIINGIPVGDCGADTGTGTIDVVARIAGATRYDTARAVVMSATGGPAGKFSRDLSTSTCNPVRTAILVSGENFPDALAAGALSASGARAGGCGGGRLPLLLTPGGKLSSEAVAALRNRAIEQVVIVGGTQAVSGQVFAEVAALDIIDSVERIAGLNRQDTAAQLGDHLHALAGFGGTALVASGVNFPDALVAGPIGGQIGAPILLSASATDLGSVSAAWIKGKTNTVQVFVLGGTSALSDGVMQSVRNAITSRP